jgi:hypothetical protein
VNVAEATAAVEAAEADLDAAKRAALLADREYGETLLSAEAVDPVALTLARGKRDDARNAVREAEARFASARDEHAAALAAYRAEDAREAARVAEEARQADHAARVAPQVAALDAALAVVEEAARDVMRVASVVLDPDVVMRAEHPDARARLVAGVHRAAPFVTAVARAEVAGEDLAGAADDLAMIDPSHAALAPTRMAIAATSTSIIFEQTIKLAALVGRTDRPHAHPVGRARAGVAELAFSRKTGRFWGGDRAARETHLRALIPPAIDVIVPQVIEQIRPWAPCGPFFVNVGGTQRHEIPEDRPQLRTAEGELRNAFGAPATPREQIISYLCLDVMEHELVPDVTAPPGMKAA